MNELTPAQILATRQHEVFNNRESQINRNLLALDGGSPYIDVRLKKYQGEPDIFFQGSDGKQGRKGLAFLQNHFGKAVREVVQFIYENLPDRDGVDDDFQKDVSQTHDRQSLNEFLSEATKVKLAGGWCWGKADRPTALTDAEGMPRRQSVLEKEQRGDRVFWTLYDPRKVVDWKFNDRGSLEWLMTEDFELMDMGPTTERAFIRRRILWTPLEAITYHIVKNDKKEDEAQEVDRVTHDFGFVPFQLYGTITAKPNRFDDAEMIQSAILNLDSADLQSTLNSCHAQMVFPAAMVEDISEKVSGKAQVDLLVGENNPIVESSDEKGISRYITPSYGDLSRNPEKVKMLTRALYEALSLAIRKDTKEAESAEAKDIDFRNVSAFLASQSAEAEDFEQRMVDMSVQIDSTFAEYSPIYNRNFSSMQIMDRVATWLQLAQIDMPASYDVQHKKVGVQLLEDVSGGEIPVDVKATMIEDIEAQTPAV